MKKQCLLSMSLLMTLSMATTLPVYASTTDHLLINQVYGTGGKTECAVSHNFIELYNPTENDISLAGYEIIYNDETLDLNDEAIIKSSCSYLIIGDEAEES
ncbi:MAG: lamin tail domain-containing protein, partial [Bacilli bacterium]|nr:lamin tail domain-containing protein [Bacilli bacterium]